MFAVFLPDVEYIVFSRLRYICASRFSQNAPSPACLFEMKAAKGINNVCYLSFMFVMLSCMLIAVTCLEMANLLALL